MSSNIAYKSRGYSNNWTTWFYPNAENYNKIILEKVNIPADTRRSFISFYIGDYHEMSPRNFSMYLAGEYPDLGATTSVVVSYHYENDWIRTYNLKTNTWNLTPAILEVGVRGGVFSRR